MMRGISALFIAPTCGTSRDGVGLSAFPRGSKRAGRKATDTLSIQGKEAVT